MSYPVSRSEVDTCVHVHVIQVFTYLYIHSQIWTRFMMQSSQKRSKNSLSSQSPRYVVDIMLDRLYMYHERTIVVCDIHVVTRVCFVH